MAYANRAVPTILWRSHRSVPCYELQNDTVPVPRPHHIRDGGGKWHNDAEYTGLHTSNGSRGIPAYKVQDYRDLLLASGAANEEPSEIAVFRRASRTYRNHQPLNLRLERLHSLAMFLPGTRSL